LQIVIKKNDNKNIFLLKKPLFNTLQFI